MANATPTLEENWATHWRWEWLKTGGYDPPRFREGYAGRSCRFAAELLRAYGCTSVLDCSCGCGPRSVVLAEMGYEVVGSDFCGFAVERARALSLRLGLDIPFVHASWQELSSRIGRTFDCIVNDAVAWEPSREGLHAAAAEFAALLEPGGIVIFSGAPEGHGPESRQRCYAEAREGMERLAVAGPFERGDRRLIVVTIRELLPDAVEVTRLYIVEEGGELTVERSTIPELFRWCWDDFQAAFADVGFSDLHSQTVAIGGEERVHNVAVK